MPFNDLAEDYRTTVAAMTDQERLIFGVDEQSQLATVERQIESELVLRHYFDAAPNVKTEYVEDSLIATAFLVKYMDYFAITATKRYDSPHLTARLMLGVEAGVGDSGVYAYMLTQTKSKISTQRVDLSLMGPGQEMALEPLEVIAVRNF